MLRREEFKQFAEKIAKDNGLDLDFDYDPNIGVFSIVFSKGIIENTLTIPEEELDNSLMWRYVEEEAKELL